MTCERKHVALVILSKFFGVKGGREKVFCEMANALLEKGYEVTAICCDLKPGNPAFKLSPNVRLVNAYVDTNVPWFHRKPWSRFYNWSISKDQRFINRVANRTKKLSKCFKVVLEKISPVDIFITFHASASFLLLDGLKVTTPVISMLHEAPEEVFNTENFAVYKGSFSSSSAVQVLMPEYIPKVQALFPNLPVFCIPNVVPNFPSSTGVSKKLINVARVNIQKRPELLIDALGLVREKFPDWSCEWWGGFDLSHENLEKLQEQIAKLHLQNYFRFMGSTDNVPELLRQSSIFVFPSSSEGWGLSLTEAFSAGLPAIGCIDCSAVNSLIRDGHNGFLTEPTPEAFAKALSQLMENQELRIKLGKQAKEDMKAYSAEVVWGMWDDLIQKVIKEHQSK